jgi:hypothetical protein
MLSSAPASVRMKISCKPFSVWVTAFSPPETLRWIRTAPVALLAPSDFPPYERPMIKPDTPSNASIRFITVLHSLEVVWWRPREGILIFLQEITQGIGNQHCFA